MRQPLLKYEKRWPLSICRLCLMSIFMSRQVFADAPCIELPVPTVEREAPVPEKEGVLADLAEEHLLHLAVLLPLAPTADPHADRQVHLVIHDGLLAIGKTQRWALLVFLNFFSKKKWFLAFFIKLIWPGVGFLNRTGAQIYYIIFFLTVFFSRSKDK